MEKKIIREAVGYFVDNEQGCCRDFDIDLTYDFEAGFDIIKENMALAEQWSSKDGWFDLTYVKVVEQEWDYRADCGWETITLRLFGSRLETDEEFARRVKRSQKAKERREARKAAASSAC